MSLTKFLSLLETRALHFCRTDLFEDPFEGHYPDGMLEAFREKVRQAGTKPDPPMGDEAWLLRLTAEEQRLECFVNCWAASAWESAALWRLYINGTEGVAITTDQRTLSEQLHQSPLQIHISKVEYRDYSEKQFPAMNAFQPVLLKRQSFSHEQEVRAVIWRRSKVNATQVESDALHISVPVDLGRLVKEVYVAPQSPVWFGELIEKIVRRYKLEVPVVHSALYDRPVY